MEPWHTYGEPRFSVTPYLPDGRGGTEGVGGTGIEITMYDHVLSQEGENPS